MVCATVETAADKGGVAVVEVKNGRAAVTTGDDGAERSTDGGGSSEVGTWTVCGGDG